VTALVRHERGPLVTLTVSFEARNQYLSGLEVYGTEGSLLFPDANAFGGELLLRGNDTEEVVDVESLGDQETRGLGLEELAVALREDRPHRASGELALHVLETAEAIVAAAEQNSSIVL
jgi:hypothetical protein